MKEQNDTCTARTAHTAEDRVGVATSGRMCSSFRLMCRSAYPLVGAWQGVRAGVAWTLFGIPGRDALQSIIFPIPPMSSFGVLLAPTALIPEIDDAFQQAFAQ